MVNTNTQVKPVINQVAEKIFEKVQDKEEPNDYLKANFKDIMKEVRTELGYQNLSAGAFYSRYKEAQHIASGLIHKKNKEKK